MNSYGWGLPIQASTYAAQVDWSIHLMHGFMTLVFVLWGAFMIYCLVRYRSRPGVTATYTHKVGFYSYVPDALILAFEIWLIFFVGVPIWSHIMDKLPSKEESNVVEMAAEQFAWNFHYPGPDGQFGKKDIHLMGPANPLGLDEDDPASKDDVVVLNELHIPLGKPTLMHMTSKDVIHSFFVPEFRIKRDVVPGMRVPLWFEPTLTGKFEIGCAQLCGLGHYRMRGDVYVHTQEEFDNWYKEQIQAK